MPSVIAENACVNRAIWMGFDEYMRVIDGEGTKCALILHEDRQAWKIGAEFDADTQHIRLVDLDHKGRFFMRSQKILLSRQARLVIHC